MEKSGTTYTYSDRDPIPLSLICSLGKEQYEVSIKSYKAYLDLIDEQCKKISDYIDEKKI